MQKDYFFATSLNAVPEEIPESDELEAIDGSCNDDIVMMTRNRVSSMVFPIKISGIVFIVSSVVTFHVSNQKHKKSDLEGVLAMTDLLALDSATTFFICIGFLFAHAYQTMDTEKFETIHRASLIFMYSDILVSSLLCLIFGTLWQLTNYNFKYVDVVFTLVEAIFGFRSFDFKLHGPHSMNVTAWPVHCVLWCILISPFSCRSNAYIRQTFSRKAVYIVYLMGIFGIVGFNLSCIIHSQGSIFYLHATSVFYRILEFNVGQHCYNVFVDDIDKVMAARDFLCEHRWFIFYLYVCVWWSHIGNKTTDTENMNTVATVSESGVKCDRLYPNNSCLLSHEIISIRGCILGLVVVCSHDSLLSNGETESGIKCLMGVRTIFTAICFTWPVCLGFHLGLLIFAGEEFLERYNTSISVVTFGIIYLFTILYDSHAKVRICSVTENAIEIVAEYVSNLKCRLFSKTNQPEVVMRREVTTPAEDTLI